MSRSGKLWIRDQRCFIFIFGISCEELPWIWSYNVREFVHAVRGGQQILVFLWERKKTMRKNLVFVLFSSPGSFVRGWRSKYGAIHHFLWPQTTLLDSIIMSHDHFHHHHCHNHHHHHRYKPHCPTAASSWAMINQLIIMIIVIVII